MRSSIFSLSDFSLSGAKVSFRSAKQIAERARVLGVILLLAHPAFELSVDTFFLVVAAQPNFFRRKLFRLCFPKLALLLDLASQNHQLLIKFVKIFLPLRPPVIDGLEKRIDQCAAN